MMAAHRMTPARRAALKKAQAASARKRRGKGKGKLAKANRRNVRTRTRVKAGLKLAAGAAAIGAVAYASHASARAAGNKRRAKASAASSARWSAINTDFSRSAARSRFHYKTRPKAHSGPATKHNRVFVGGRHGGVSVRKRY